MLFFVFLFSVIASSCLAHDHSKHKPESAEKPNITNADLSQDHSMHTPPKFQPDQNKCPMVSDVQSAKSHELHGKEKKHTSKQHSNHAMPKDLPLYKTMHDPLSPWANPKIKPSPPPKLVGKQMGVVNTIGIPPMGYELDGTIKVFRLIAQPIEQFITDGKEPDYEKYIEEKNKLPKWLVHHSNIVQKLRAWGFNGSTPGPTIEANEGDTVRIIVSNELPEPLTVHWHGIELPNDQDGAGGFTQPVIMPGECRTYQFTLYQSGTCFYHGEFNLTKASLFGLVGAFVIHPKKYEYKIDKEFAITMQEWRILPGNIYPDIMSMDFNWFTFNGHSAPSIPAMIVNQGERVRIRLVNMSMDAHPIHWHGYTGWIVGTEGGPIPKSAQWPVNSVDVPAGASRDIEFVAWNPGIWLFHCHKLHHVLNGHADVPMGIMPHGGMFTVIYVKPTNPQAPWRHPNQDQDDHYQHAEKESYSSHEDKKNVSNHTDTSSTNYKHTSDASTMESLHTHKKNAAKHEGHKEAAREPAHGNLKKGTHVLAPKKKWVYENKQWVEQTINCYTEQTGFTSQGATHAH